MQKKFKTVSEYLSVLPESSRGIMERLRSTIKKAAPEAEELISYNMPAFRYHGMLVYYAAHKEHIGFYPGNARLIEVFKDDLVGFKTSEGTVQFPFDKPIPLSLISKIVKFRVKENAVKAKK